MARTSRYTRTVSWRHRTSLVLLIVLTAIPVSGAVCAMLCDSEATTRAAAHHGSGKPCDDEQATPPSSGPQVRSTSSHNCSDHDAATRVAATTTAARANSVPEPSLLAAIPLHDSISNSQILTSYWTTALHRAVLRSPHPRSFSASDPHHVGAL